MNIKTIFLVIILSILIGFGIFFGDMFLKKSNVLTTSQTTQPTPQASSLYPTPPTSPKPSLHPIGPETNLKEEIDKLTPPDFSEDINSLKQAI